MSETIKHIARQSGATNEVGGRACNSFCFTEKELDAFAAALLQLCFDSVIVTKTRHDDYRSQIEESAHSDCAASILNLLETLKK